LTKQEISSATDLDSEYQIPEIVRQLTSVLLLSDGRYSLFHKSINDWLVTHPETNRYFTSRKVGVQRLAEHCWKEYKHGLATMSWYALRYLSTHLIELDRLHDAKAFLNEHIIASDPKHSSFFRLSSDQENFRNELQTVLYMLGEHRRWHPQEPQYCRSLGPQEDYCEVYQFPCCGKFVVIGDGKPSQMRDDGCQEDPNNTRRQS
jgi:hypothetical protein